MPLNCQKRSCREPYSTLIMRPSGDPDAICARARLRCFRSARQTTLRRQKDPVQGSGKTGVKRLYCASGTTRLPSPSASESIEWRLQPSLVHRPEPTGSRTLPASPSSRRISRREWSLPSGLDGPRRLSSSRRGAFRQSRPTKRISSPKNVSDGPTDRSQRRPGKSAKLSNPAHLFQVVFSKRQRRSHRELKSTPTESGY